MGDLIAESTCVCDGNIDSIPSEIEQGDSRKTSSMLDDVRVPQNSRIHKIYREKMEII